MRLRIGIGMAAALCAMMTAAAGRADAIFVTEFPLPVADSGPRGITAGPDGNVWFTEAAGSRVGKVTPIGDVTDFSNGAGVSTGGLKFDIAVGSDGNLWYTDPQLNAVGRISPLAAGVEFTTGITSLPRGIAAGPDGNLWYAGDAGKIGRVTLTGAVTEFGTGITPGSRPLDITAGPDGNLWFTELFGRHIGRITPTGVVTEFGTGISPDALLSGITAGPDGALWFTDLLRRVGRITTAGVVTEFTLPPLAQPRGITVGPDGNLWFTDESRRRLGRITTGGVVTDYPLTLAGNTQPLEITAGPNRALWFTTSGNRVARAFLQPSVSTEAATGITTTAARISGSVDPFASSSGYVVEYGRAAAYGSATESRVIPPSAAAVKVTATLTGLAPGTRYHYRVVASNIGGTTEGADATFTTSGVPGAGGGGAGSLPRDRTGPRIRIAGAPLVARNGRVAISLGCPLTEPLGCRGRVRLATVRRFAAGASTGAPRRVLRLGTARFRIGGGQTRAVTIVVSLRGRALVGRLGRLRVRAIAVAEDSAGNRRTTVRRLIMRRV